MTSAALDRRPKDCDRRCPDGFVAEGWRKVFPGGYIKFANDKHYHSDLIEYTGKWFFVSLNNWTGNAIDVWMKQPWVGRVIIAHPKEGTKYDYY